MLLAPVTYDPEWPHQFQAFHNALNEAYRAPLQIAHIGSTAVPGLCAKPIIDIQMALCDLATFDPAPLKGAGFELIPDITRDDAPSWHPNAHTPWRKFYARCIVRGTRVAHLHIREIGAPNHRFSLLFRDFLRASDPVRDLYSEMKQAVALASVETSDASGSGHYLDLKTPFVSLIALQAESWAAQTGWSSVKSQKTF